MRNYSYINRICLGVLIGMILPSVCGCNQDSDSSPTVQKGILGDGSQTLTMWYVDSYADRNINTVRSVQEMEEYTGIHIEYQVGNYSNMQESYLLMFASGDIPDMVFHGDGFEYPGGGNKAIDDGIYLDMAPYVEKYMPNYRELIKTDETVEKMTKTDNGMMWSVYMLRCDDTGTPTPEMSSSGLVIRQDWLDELGLDTPVTIDDWYEALTLFKTEMGATAPLAIGNTANTGSDSFLSAYGVLSEFYMNEDGVVAFGPVQDGYRQWLELYAKWYGEGLIDPDFTSGNAFNYLVVDASLIATGVSGAGTTIWGFTQDVYYTNGTTTDPDFCLSPVNNPVLNEGDTAYAAMPHYTAECSVAVSATAKNPELVAKWLDYQYTIDAMKYNCYGIEGETYTYDESTGFQYTDLIMDNPDGRTPTDAVAMNCRGDGPGLVTWERYNHYNDPEVIGAEAVWDTDSKALCLPEVTLTEEEGRNYTTKTLVKYCSIVVATLPIMCVYPFVQKYFVSGVMIGSVKG